MSFFDIVSEKVNEFLGGGVEEVANKVQDAGQQQVEDIVDQSQGILPGGDNQ